MTAQLAIDSRGAGGLPILFAHSFAGDLSHWGASLEHLRQQRRVVAFDFSSHGSSPYALHNSYEELVKNIDAVADAQQLGTFMLVGHSMGAAVATEYAASHSARVAALVLVDPPPAPGAIPPEQIQPMLAALDRDPYAFVEQFWNQQMFIDSREEVKLRLLAGLRKLPREAAIDLTKEAFATDSTVALRRYVGPKFAIVTPRNDAPLSLHKVVAGTPYLVVKGTGHWIHLDKPDEFNAALDEFLPTIRSR